MADVRRLKDGGPVIQVEFHALSHRGRVRKSNEDSFAYSPSRRFGILADGMGGHEAGEVASRMAVRLLADRLAKAVPQRGERTQTGYHSLLRELLGRWLQEANRAIYERGQARSGGDERPMGTTLALLAFYEDHVLTAHIGDSRIYRFRKGKLKRLTRDHTITATETRPDDSQRLRRYLTRTLGTKPDTEPDVRTRQVEPGDCYLLCSDGLTDGVSDRKIQKVLAYRKDDPARIVQDLVGLANHMGGRDNITVLLACVAGGQDALP